MNETRLGVKLGAEFLGTFGLVFGGCGSAIIAATFLSEDKVQLGIGFLGVAFAFGLTVLTGAYAFGHVSGGHFNPAVTVGLAIAKRFDWKGVLPYVVTQIVAATLAALVLFIIANGKPGFSAHESGFASNGYGAHSPGGYGLGAALVAEIVTTAAFVYVILGATDDRAPRGFAPIAIGLSLTLIHLVTIPVTNTSVNPARSIGVAWFAGSAALKQLWLFIVAPIIGAVIAGVSYGAITGARPAALDVGVANNPNIGTAPTPDE
jgi:aquaporin Z